MYSSEDLVQQIIEVKVDFEQFKNYSENMDLDEKDRFIQYLVGKVNMFELHKRASELAVEMPARTRRGMMPPTVRTRRTSFAYHSVISTVKLHGMSCWHHRWSADPKAR